MADSDRFTTLPNGAVYDKKKKQIVKPSAKPPEDPKSPDTEKKQGKSGNSSKWENKSPDSKNGKRADEVNVGAAHTRIAREILEYNSQNPPKKTDAEWLKARGFWYLDRCIEEGVSPTAMGLVIAWGFTARDQSLLLSGNSGLPQDCKEVIEQFKQAYESAQEGALQDSKAGAPGRIFALKNRLGWSDNPNQPIAEQKQGQIKSPEELKKALAKIPGLDLIDEPKPIDVDFEVVE